MDRSVYGMVGQMHHTERSLMQKPRRRSYHCQHKWTYREETLTITDYPECPKWHRIALRLTSLVLVILVATVIGLIVWVSHLSTIRDKNGEQTFSNESGTQYCNCMNISPRKQQDLANSTANFCPDDWLQRKKKCYKFFMNFKSWVDSQASCSAKKSHLLMIQDKAELDFIQSNIQDGTYFWIGLNMTHPQKTWTWLDGTPLNPQLFEITGRIEENVCAMITKKGVFSENCHGQSFWICQEEISSTKGRSLN